MQKLDRDFADIPWVLRDQQIHDLTLQVLNLRWPRVKATILTVPCNPCCRTADAAP